jgi:glycosyltransferase involved in cell wall biosynthesis
MHDGTIRLVVVLGMHRSGTSAVTRGLQVLGVDLGARLMSAIAGINDKGFWEDLDVYDLNVEVLRRVGHDWCSNSPIEEAELLRDDLAPLRSRAVQLLREKTAGKTMFGIKDPRLPRLLPFWRPVFEDLGLRIGYVIAVRHPMSVARSLGHRDGFRAEKSYYLWLNHVVPSILGTEGHPRVVVDYDALVDDPERQLARISERLRLPSPSDASLKEFRGEFLEEELRHTRFRPEDLTVGRAVPVDVIDAYGLLEKLAKDELAIDCPEVHRAFVRFDQRIGEMLPAFHYMTELETECAGERKMLIERDKRLSDLNQAIAKRDELIENLKQTVQSLVVDRDSRKKGLEELQSAFDKSVREHDGRVSYLNRAIAERDGQIKSIRMSLSAVYESKSWRLTAPLRGLARGISWAARYVPRGVGHDRRVATCNPPQAPAAIADIPKGSSDERASAVFRILLVSHYCPTRAHAGGLRILDIYALIRRQCPSVQLDLFTHHRPGIDWLLDDAYRIFHNVYLSRQEDLTPEGLVGLRGASSTYDVVDLQFHQTGYHIDAFRQLGRKIVFTPMESLSKVLFLDLRTKSFMQTSLRTFRIAASLKMAADEVNFTLKADEVVCVSRADAAFLRAVTSCRHIRGVDTGVSQLEFAEALRSSFTRTAASERPCRVLYVAYFGSETNVTALHWYLERVHPVVKSSVPGYTLSVVGRGDLSGFVKYRDGSVDLVGEVPAIAPCIQQARVGIAPALGGSGFRGKVNQYAILGVPSVVSPIAFKGLSYRDGVNIFVAEAPEVFAERCIRLLSDFELNDRMGEAARKHCLERYSWQSKWPAIRAIYNLGEFA